MGDRTEAKLWNISSPGRGLCVCSHGKWQHAESWTVSSSELGFGKKNLKRVTKLHWKEETGGREARQETPVVVCSESEAGLG